MDRPHRREAKRLFHAALIHRVHDIVGIAVIIGAGRVRVHVDDRQPVIEDP
jgi:hypothetical protein